MRNILRDYQTEQVYRLVHRMTYHLKGALVSCVGSGKTIVLSLVASTLLKRKVVKRVIIAAPYNMIIGNFLNRSNTSWLTGNGKFDTTSIYRYASTDSLVAIIKGGAQDAIIMTTHSALASPKVREALENSEDLSDLMVCVDEAHHVGPQDCAEFETQIGAVNRIVSTKGGRTLEATATPWRTDGGRTRMTFDPEECNPILRTLGEQMKDGLAPSLEVEYFRGEQDGGFELTNAGEFGLFELGHTKVARDAGLRLLADQIIGKWRADGFPKAICIVLPGQASTDSMLLKEIISQVEFSKEVALIRGRRHPKVLTVVGDLDNDLVWCDGRQMTQLEYDNHKGGRVFDIVLACRRTDEGTDVPTASHMYMIGIPGNLRLTHQRIGRIMRDKLWDDNGCAYTSWFGTKWAHTSKVIFFLPKRESAVMALDRQASKQLLCVMYSGEHYQSFCNSSSTLQGIRMELEGKLHTARGSDRHLIDTVLAVVVGAQLYDQMSLPDTLYDMLMISCQDNDGSKTVGDVLRTIKDSNLQLEERRLLLRHLLEHGIPESARATLDIPGITRRLLRSCKAARAATETFSGLFDMLIDSVSEQFSAEKMATDKLDGAVTRAYTRLSGEEWVDYAFRCQNAMPSQLECVRYIISWRDANKGKSPKEVTDIDGRERCHKYTSYLMGIKKGAYSKTTLNPLAVHEANRAGYGDIFLEQSDKKDAHALSRAMNLKEFIDVEKREPSQNSRGQENSLSNWVIRARAAYRDEGSLRWRKCQEYLEANGLMELIEREPPSPLSIMTVYQKTESVLDFIRDNNRRPSTSKEAKERGLGKWLAKQYDKSTATYTPECIKLAIGRGIPDLFTKPKEVPSTLANATQLVLLYKGASSKNHPQLTSKLARYRLNILKNPSRYNEDISFIKRCLPPEDYTVLLAHTHTDHKTRAKQFVTYYRKHKRIPSKKHGLVTNDKHEATLGRWAINLRYNFKKNLKDAETAYKAVLPILA